MTDAEKLLALLSIIDKMTGTIAHMGEEVARLGLCVSSLESLVSAQEREIADLRLRVG